MASCALGMVADTSHAGRASCPLSVSVNPFPRLSFGSYTVRVVDGGEGDMDGIADGSCSFQLHGCLGTGGSIPDSCPGETFASFNTSVRGGPSREVKEALARDVLTALGTATNTEVLLRGYQGLLTFVPEQQIDDLCFDVPVRLPARGSRGWRIGLRSTIRLAAPAFPPVRRQTAYLECVPAPAEGSIATTEARCTVAGAACELDDIPEPTPSATPTAGPSGVRTATRTATPGAVRTPTRTPTPAPTVAGNTYYLSPAGNDANAGTTTGKPWKTFSRAFNSQRPLKAGDTLVLLDGTYTTSTTGLPTINCASTGGNANHGTPTKPITIRAQNERKAFLSSNGTHSGLDMYNCAWWRLEGLRAENADNSTAKQTTGYPFRFSNVSNLTARRLLGARNNRAHNTHVFGVEDSTNVLLEECEAYFFHRHAFNIWRSRFVTLRRCYANSMLYGQQGCCSAIDNRDYGDEAVSLYGTSDSIIENCISENRANGYQIHGIDNGLDPSDSGGRRNKVLGSISFDDGVGVLVASRPKQSTTLTTFHNARDNLVQDVVVVGGAANQVFGRQAANLQVKNATLFGSSNGGLVLDSSNAWNCHNDAYRCGGTGEVCTSNANCTGACDALNTTGCCVRNLEGCSFSATNVLSFGHAGSGIIVQSQQPSWLVDSTNSAINGASYWNPVGYGGHVSSELGSTSLLTDNTGNLRRALQLTPTGMGLGTGQCIMWVPSGSNMKGQGKSGADLGANILYRYENGSLTQQRLWAPTTGTFPCGAVIAGVNDGPKRCSNIHTRLNVNTNGCSFPSGY